MTCDVCGASDPPRNPTWRSNTEKVCDPCWYRLQAAIRERTEALVAAAPSVTEPETPAAPSMRTPLYGRAFGKIMQKHPTVDVRLVNDILRIAWIEAEAAASPAETAPDPFEDWSEILTSDDAYEGGQADD